MKPKTLTIQPVSYTHLLVYFQKHASKEVLEHWNILVGRQPLQNIGLRTEDGWDISGEDVRIWLEAQGENSFNISAYCEKRRVPFWTSRVATGPRPLSSRASMTAPWAERLGSVSYTHLLYILVFCPKPDQFFSFGFIPWPCFFLFHLGYPFTWTTFFHFYQAIIPLCFIVLNPLIQ